MSLGVRGVKSNRALFQHIDTKAFVARVATMCADDVEEMLVCGCGDDLQFKWPVLLPLPVAAEVIVHTR